MRTRLPALALLARHAAQRSGVLQVRRQHLLVGVVFQVRISVVFQVRIILLPVRQKACCVAGLLVRPGACAFFCRRHTPSSLFGLRTHW
jgi:hypothetical protein